MDGAGALVRCLKEMGTQRVYGIIGTSNIEFVDSLHRSGESIRYISCRHERVAASMADAEGRLTGKPGVVLTHSGPGALNAMISLGNAYKDCSPVIAVTGAVKRRLQGSDGMLEIDHQSVFRGICKWTRRLSDADEIPEVFSRAYGEAMSGCRGPVLIEVPEDVWSEELSTEVREVELAADNPPVPDKGEVDRVVNLLVGSKRPLLLAGGGVAYSRSSSQLTFLAERLQVPVITTGNGRGTISELHPLCLGRAGFGGGNVMADTALTKAELVLGLGCTLSDMTTYEFTLPVTGRVILVNIDPAAQAPQGPEVEIIEGDVRDFLELALASSEEMMVPDRSEWMRSLDPARATWKAMLDQALSTDRPAVSPARVISDIADKEPEDTVVTVGAGMHLLYPMAFWPCRRPLTFLSTVNFGAMGFGLAASLAAGMVYPLREVVAVLGDGDFMMTAQDLETAVREGIGIRVVILNDFCYRVLKFRQRLQFDGRICGTVHGNPDFALMAESFGARGITLDRPADVDVRVSEFLDCDGPVVLDVHIDPDDVAPLNLEATLRMSAG